MAAGAGSDRQGRISPGTGEESAATPSLSVVISTREPASHIYQHCQALLRQVQSVGGELIIISGAASDPAGPLQGVRVHSIPGGSVFDCRALAPSVAKADIVALTEDHCVIPPDWCARILRHFAEKPDLVLLGGAVDNGSTKRLEDLMNYWMTFAAYAPGQVIARHPAIAQYIFKKAAVGSALKGGELESSVLARFAAIPGAILIDPQLQVTHVQSHGFFNTFAVHYHNGRTGGGLLLRPNKKGAITLRKAVRWTVAGLRAHMRSAATAFATGQKSAVSMAAHLALIFPLVLAHGLGRIVGYLKGPGDSPRQLQ